MAIKSTCVHDGLKSSVQTNVDFCPSAEAEASAHKNAECSAEDEASDKDQSFCQLQKLLQNTEDQWCKLLGKNCKLDCVAYSLTSKNL